MSHQSVIKRLPVVAILVAVGGTLLGIPRASATESAIAARETVQPMETDESPVPSAIDRAIAQSIPRTDKPLIPPQDLLPPQRPTLPEVQPIPAPSPVIPAIPVLPTPMGTPAPPVPGSIPTVIVVTRFEVVGSTVFSPAELQQVTAAFTNRPLAFAELLQVQEAITRLYVDNGYITSGALLPPQTLEGGVVQIQVVEGGLEAITVTGTRRLQPAYVRSRLELATGKPLNSHRLLEALQLLQLNPLIQTISAELSAGTQPGQNRLDVKVREADSFALQWQLDNGRSPAVGSIRGQVNLTQANLLGLGDGLSVGYEVTAGSHLGEFTYTLPINPRNGTLSFKTSISSSRIIEDPFEPLRIRGKSHQFNLTLRQPLIETPSQEFALGLTAAYADNQTSLLDIPLPLSAGADADGETRIFALRLFQEWLHRSAQSVFAVRSQFSIGVPAFNASVNDTPPDSQFFAWRGQAQWVRLLAPDTLLLARSDLQLASRPLVPLEQFSLGGVDSVRGYRQDLLLTDNGLFGSVELRVPVLRVPQIGGLLQVTPFIDVGNVWNVRGDNPDPQTLVGTGFGLRWQQGDRLSARLDWGIPLISVQSDRRTWQEQGVYFSIVYSLF